jgi:hypothetical protein
MEHVSCAIHAQDFVAIRECRAAVCALVGYAALRFRLRASDAHGTWSLVSRYLVRTTPPTRLTTVAYCGLGFGLHPSSLAGRTFKSCYGRLSVSTELNRADSRTARQGCSRSCILSPFRQEHTESLTRILGLSIAQSSPISRLTCVPGLRNLLSCPPRCPEDIRGGRVGREFGGHREFEGHSIHFCIRQGQLRGLAPIWCSSTRLRPRVKPESLGQSLES